MIEVVEDGVADRARRSDGSHDPHLVYEVLLVADDRLQGVMDHCQCIGEFLDHGAPLFVLLLRCQGLPVLVVGHGDDDGQGWVGFVV
jgi:hypothetical protein